MKPTLYTIGILFMALAVMWSAAAVRLTKESEKPPLCQKLTLEMYDAIQPGMTVEAAQSTIGFKPTTEDTKQTPGGRDAKQLYWKDTQGAFIYLRTVDGLVTAKSSSFRP